jgi:hypothetical protein
MTACGTPLERLTTTACSVPPERPMTSQRPLFAIPDDSPRPARVPSSSSSARVPPGESCAIPENHHTSSACSGGSLDPCFFLCPISRYASSLAAGSSGLFLFFSFLSESSTQPNPQISSPAGLTPLSATLTRRPRNVDSKELKRPLSPLSATLTKTQGGIS